jgi:hypothetical protein
MFHPEKMSIEELKARIRKVRAERDGFGVEYTESRRYCTVEISTLERELIRRGVKVCPRCHGTGRVTGPDGEASVRLFEAAPDLLAAAEAALEILGAARIDPGTITDLQAMQFQIVLTLTGAIAKAKGELPNVAPPQ